MTSRDENQFLWENASFKRFMVYAGVIWCFWINADRQCKLHSCGFIIAKVVLFSMDRKAMKGEHNQGINARISVSKVIRIKLNFSSLTTA